MIRFSDVWRLAAPVVYLAVNKLCPLAVWQGVNIINRADPFLRYCLIHSNTYFLNLMIAYISI